MILKTKPSAIRENKVFTLDMCEISIQSAKADDNGAYISKGSTKKFYAYDEWSRTTHKNENGVWYVNMKSSKGKTEKMQKKQRESKSTTVAGGKQFSEPEKHPSTQLLTKSITFTKDHYTTLNALPNMLHDVYRFCVLGNAIFRVDATFELVDGVWLTDTTYCNEALVNFKRKHQSSWDQASGTSVKLGSAFEGLQANLSF